MLRISLSISILISITVFTSPIGYDDPIPECRCDFFQRFLLRFTGRCSQLIVISQKISGIKKHLREIEISNNQEEKRTRDKNIVVVLVYICECTGPCFGDYNRNKSLAPTLS